MKGYTPRRAEVVIKSGVDLEELEILTYEEELEVATTKNASVFTLAC